MKCQFQHVMIYIRKSSITSQCKKLSRDTMPLTSAHGIVQKEPLEFGKGRSMYSMGRWVCHDFITLKWYYANFTVKFN